MDLRKLRKFVRENNLTFTENTTETEREFIIEQKDSKYKLKALFTENNKKCKFVLENAKNLVVEEYETEIENNDDMINKVKDAVSLYDMIDTIDEGVAGDTFDNSQGKLDIDDNFLKTIPNSIEDDKVDEELLIDQPQRDQDIELIEGKNKDAVKEIYKGGDGQWVIDLNPGWTTPYGTNCIMNKTKKACLDELEQVTFSEEEKRKFEQRDEDLEDELGIVESTSIKTSDTFAKKYAIKTNGGFIKLINNDLSYEVVENPESATYTSDLQDMKAKLINLAKSDIRPLKAGKIVDLNELQEGSMKEDGIEIAGKKPSAITSDGHISEALEVEVKEVDENEVEENTIEEASKLINNALKIIKKLYNEETDGTIKTILGSIDLNLQIPQGQIDELKNVTE